MSTQRSSNTLYNVLLNGSSIPQNGTRLIGSEVGSGLAPFVTTTTYDDESKKPGDLGIYPDGRGTGRHWILILGGNHDNDLCI